MFYYKINSRLPYFKGSSIDQNDIMTDGHTRTCYLVEQGYEYIPTVQEKDQLDWEAYRINVKDSKIRSVYSAKGLIKCILPREGFQEKWNKYCDDVHRRLAYEKNQGNY